MSLSSIYRYSIAILLICGAVPVLAQPVTLPRNPSPAAKVSQTIGISSVSVNYSRPSVKGRKIWGALVPYGWNKQGFGNGNSAPWRAGANENTVLTLSHDAVIENHPVPAGSYGLFLTINEDNTGEVILSKDYRSWGSFFYDESKDQMRAKIQVKDIPMQEMLTYEFENDTKNDADLVLKWEKKAFPIKIAFNTDSIVIANAAQELQGSTGFTPQGFISAANYTLQNKVKYDEGLAWIDKAITTQKTFTTLSIKSRLLAATGKTAQSDSLMKEAIVLANELELNSYGYQLLGSGDKAGAIAIFQMNTKRYPKSANTWDSLGEGYALAGDKKNAIASFKKSLGLNPTDAIRANSEKYLKELGAM